MGLGAREPLPIEIHIGYTQPDCKPMLAYAWHGMCSPKEKKENVLMESSEWRAEKRSNYIKEYIIARDRPDRDASQKSSPPGPNEIAQHGRNFTSGETYR